MRRTYHNKLIKFTETPGHARPWPWGLSRDWSKIACATNTVTKIDSIVVWLAQSDRASGPPGKEGIADADGGDGLSSTVPLQYVGLGETRIPRFP